MRQTFGMICLLSVMEAAYFNSLEQSTFACRLGFPELLASSALTRSDRTWMQQKVRAVKILSASNRFFFLFF